MFNYVNFQHDTIKRYIILFGTIFNQIYIGRTSSTGEELSLQRIPIAYGPKEKVINRVNADPELTRPFGNILPFMTFEMKRIWYDRKRHLATQGREVSSTTNDDLAAFTWNPVPYNILFELNIVVKNAQDGVKILEQILPFFTPSWTATVKIIEDPEIIKDIPLSIIDHDSTDSWEGSFTERRYILHTLRFEMHSWLFGPTIKSPIIKLSEVNYGTTTGEVDATTSVYPGLTVDGEPSTDPNNTVPWSEIGLDDDWGFIETWVSTDE